ncbi:helix-turn-helix domain-containing protein [Idiomarina xiamenensis]|uniref:XRE family transcriptional regulator n=1 Tax=Idiomarina xiamenensis 10-D-4 TaxID=740709 RepID=K2JUE5_9GAMM|nr:helix-turn-helix transcriptional regulator [Idiomarina xiamenensis]EKE87056.1 XRE family transcriptional regulator [Idiomarina xiamenensis 10-D-4]
MSSVLNQLIAEKLKRIRKQRGLSLDKLASLTGVSKAMLGQIERGESSPTIAKLWQIATGLQVPLSTLLAQTENTAEALVQPLATPGVKVRTLFPYSAERGFEVHELTFAAGAESHSEPHQLGTYEHLIVLSGCLQLKLTPAAQQPSAWISLTAGQQYAFHANVAHSYKNSSTEPCCFHDIIQYRQH